MALDLNIYGFDRVVFKHEEVVFPEWESVLLDDSGTNPPSEPQSFPIIRVGEARSERLCRGDFIRFPVNTEWPKGCRIRFPPDIEWIKIDDLKYIDRMVLITLEGMSDVVPIDRGVLVEVLIA